MTAATRVSVVIPVYKDGKRALSAVKHLLEQHLPNAVEREIIIVDDGSPDDSASVIRDLQDERVHLLRLPENRGRSVARNEGAHRARGEHIVFLDSDCRPAGTTFLAEHVAALSRGFVASVGHVVGDESGFWHRYQRDASLRREKQHLRGESYSGSSQNLAVLKSAFEKVGGFDVRYRHYGFEDRDLLLRLGENGRIAWTAEATVQHMDTLTLGEVCRKMKEAGRYSSAYFAARHPDAYRTLGYAAIDARRRPWLRPLGMLLGPIVPNAAKNLDRALQNARTPYLPAKAAVKVLAALSFLHGTLQALPGDDPPEGPSGDTPGQESNG